MAFLVYQAFLIAMAAIVVGLVRLFWFVLIVQQLEKECILRERDRDRLEQEIVLARLKCAASNPEAAAILSAWEAARVNRMSFKDQIVYNRFFDRNMGGESRAVVLTHEESVLQIFPDPSESIWAATSPEPSQDSSC